MTDEVNVKASAKNSNTKADEINEVNELDVPRTKVDIHEDHGYDYAPATTEETKRCKCCGRVLNVLAFRKSSKNPNKREDICMECVRRKQEESRVRRKQQQAANEAAIAIEEGRKTNPELANFTARDLILELRARGYKGKLTYVVVKEVAI